MNVLNTPNAIISDALAQQNARLFTPPPAPQPTYSSRMIVSGDLVVRKVNNGYRIMVVNGMGESMEEYIATDIDHLHEVIKLASVNHSLAKAK